MLNILILGLAGCGPAITSIGRPGTGDGEFRDPRGVAVSDDGVAVLDRTGRLQIFGLDGRFRRAVEVVPGDVRRGLPTGVTWLDGGALAIAHTHQSRVVVLAPDGSVRRTFGEYGSRPGQFLYPQRVARDTAGRLYVAEYGMDPTSAANRVQVLDEDGAVVRILGGGRDGEGGLLRPMAAVPLPGGRVLVADQAAGLVLFAEDGRSLGRFGPPPPEGAVTQGACLGADGEVYVVDFARHELRRHAADGALLGVLGGPDDPDAPFVQPWDVAWHDGRVYVADLGHHRVARVDPGRVGWRKP